MPRFIDDEALRLAFSIHQQPGVYALLLGSGLSSAAGIKTGWGITIDLIRRVGAQRRETAERTDAEWETWYREQTGRAPDYSELLAELGRRPAERQPIIASYIEPTEADRAEGRKLPTAAHKAIARLVARGYIRVILTTNFDRLLENALHEAGVEPVVIASPDQCNGAKPLQHVSAGSCTIIKLHGDYLDVRSLNTAEELEFYKPAIETLLARVFDEYGLLICGWSGVWDTALRDAMLRAPGRRYSTWWASLGPLAAQAQDLARHRDAQLVTIDGADGFFCGLADQVELIEQTRRPPPASIELLIAAAKRYIAKPKPRIELADLVQELVDQIGMLLRSSAFNSDAQLDTKKFENRVRTLDAKIEGLAMVLFLIGRWGDDETDEIAAQAITNLHAVALDLNSSGHTGYLALHGYPAMVCYTMLNAGFAQGKRWIPLRQIAVNRLPTAGGSEPTVGLLLATPWEYRSHTGEFWVQFVPPRHGRAFPAHLRSITKGWLRRLSETAVEHDFLLDTADLMAAFVLHTQNHASTINEAKSKGETIRVWVSSWAASSDIYGRLLAELSYDHPIAAVTKYSILYVSTFQEAVRNGDIIR